MSFLRLSILADTLVAIASHAADCCSPSAVMIKQQLACCFKSSWITTTGPLEPPQCSTCSFSLLAKFAMPSRLRRRSNDPSNDLDDTEAAALDCE